MTSAADLPVPGPVGDRIEDQSAWYDRKSIVAQRKYKGTKLLQLLAAAAVPVCAAAGVGAAVTAAFGGALLVLEGVQQVGQYHQVWIDYRSAWELLQREKFLFLSRAGDYARVSDPTRLLAERVEAVVARETTGWSSLQKAAAEHEEAPAADSR